MARTILTTPILCPLLRGVALFFRWALGWKMPGRFPDNIQKAVIIGAPHTSNWDFLLMLMALLIWRVDVNWVGKHTLFKGPLGPIARWLGGIAIDRTSDKHHFVDQIVSHFNQRQHMLLVIAPEGTRKPVEKWRTGFYYMAYNAKVPILISYMDYKNREIGIHAIETPTGDAAADIARYQEFYATKTGKNPHNYFGYRGD